MAELEAEADLNLQAAEEFGRRRWASGVNTEKGRMRNRASPFLLTRWKPGVDRSAPSFRLSSLHRSGCRREIGRPFQRGEKRIERRATDVPTGKWPVRLLLESWSGLEGATVGRYRRRERTEIRATDVPRHRVTPNLKYSLYKK